VLRLKFTDLGQTFVLFARLLLVQQLLSLQLLSRRALTLGIFLFLALLPEFGTLLSALRLRQRFNLVTVSTYIKIVLCARPDAHNQFFE